MSGTGEEHLNPHVAVCVPTIGRETLWLRTVPSIFAAAVDTVEVVVVGSAAPAPADHKGTKPIVVVTSASDESSPAAKRNIGAASTTGGVLVFLDDDDELTPGALTALVEPFADDAVDFVSGVCIAVDRHGLQLEEVRPSPLGPLFGDLDAVYLAGGFAVRRRLFDDVGGYHEDLWFGENSDLVMRLGQGIQGRGSRAVKLDEVVVLHHRSGRAYLDAGGVSAEHLLDCQSHVFAEHRDLRSRWHGIAGVWAFREGHRRRARRHFRRAVVDAPGSPAAWYRLALSLFPPVASRRWDRGRP